VLLAAWIFAVSFLTLRPVGMPLDELSAISVTCLLCGSRGTADAILNIVLFVPLGLALGGDVRGLRRAILAGLALSLMIEVAQTSLPGRHASSADLLWNTLGAAVGTGVYAVLKRRLETPSLVGGRAWGMVLGIAFAVSGVLVIPAPTDDVYWGQWTPDLGSMPQYDGTVLEARLDERALPPRRVDAPAPHRSLLEGDWSLDGRVVIGGQPRAVAPILSIYDRHRREILLLGAHGDDLVFRERLLAHELGFESPDLRLPHAFASLPALDTVRVSALRRDGGTCLRLAAKERCGLGVTVARTWGLLLYVTGPPEWFRGLVDVGWLMVLFLPLGLLAVSLWDAAWGAGITGVAAAAAVLTTPLLAPTWWHVLAGVAGIVLGRVALLVLVRVLDSRDLGDRGAPQRPAADRHEWVTRRS
jgi:hypothetical protein